MPKKEIVRVKIGTHEISLACCGGPGKCESGGGLLKVSQESSEGYEEEISTCLPWDHATVLRAGMNEMLVEMANTGTAEERSAKLRSELTALNEAVNKVRGELNLV